MNELNKHILDAAIKKLSIHKAPDTVWENMAATFAALHSEETLSEAIQKLPVHVAPDGIWTAIQQALENEEVEIEEVGIELHSNHLQKAIASLKTYKAPEAVWEGIEKEILKNDVLKTAITKLPKHQAPSFIWDQIESGLDNNHTLISPPDHLWEQIDTKLEKDRYVARIRKIPLWKSVAAAAAIVGAFWMVNINLQVNTDATAFIYTEELVEENLAFAEIDDDEEAFEMINEICEEALIVCSEPAFKELKFELDELNDARNEIKEVITSYNDEPELLAQLTEIEMQRSKILKKMIAIL